jgi:hypothetical protein
MVKKYIERYWRKATLRDIADGPFPGARFRNTATMPWDYGRLIGFHHGTNRPFGSDEEWYQEAEVYHAPDPGKGYELIDPAIEKPGPGIEFLFGIHWHQAGEETPLEKDVFYRRKIVPSPTSENVAPPANCQENVTVQVSVDGKKVLVRPLLPSDEINSGDILIENGAWERAYTAVGLLQSNADRQYYREVRPQPKLKPEAAATKPEATEPVTFVAHPIQKNDEGGYLFKGKPIEDRCYAVLNEQGQFMRWMANKVVGFHPEFAHAFTPSQLLTINMRILRSIRLRAVEPVDVDKLKQELKEKLQPKLPQPVEEPKYVPFTWDDQDEFGGEWIENKACKKIELVTKFNELEGQLFINDMFANDILEDWRFVRNGMPVGKRVED